MQTGPPASESTREVVVDGIRVACRVRGALDGRRPVAVVLHGWGASSAAVASIQACLADSHDSVAPDLPGFGASAPLPTVWGSEEYLASITGLLDQLGVRRASFI